MNEIVAKIEAELERLDWLGTDEQPCQIIVSADDCLPEGWVRLADDRFEGYGSGLEVLSDLEQIKEGDEYFTGINLICEQPTSSRVWPEDLIDIEQLEEGTPNDNPLSLITIKTNAGTRYAAGCHGVNCCALEDSFQWGGICGTREEALKKTQAN
jgi:hypothetical protein